MIRIQIPFIVFLVTICTQRSETIASEPYCGVYCIYAACDTLGVSIEFETLLSNKYVVGEAGSSIDSLNLAANELGLTARKLSGLGRFDLHFAQSPLILHVRSDSTRPDFDHWILFLGSLGGKAKVLDPNLGEMQLPFEELLTLWDGAALSISKSNTDQWVLRWCGFLVRALCMCGIAILIQVAFKPWKNGKTSNANHRSTLFGSLCVFCSLGLLGIVMDHFTGGRLLANPYPTRVMTNLYMPASFPEIGSDELKSLLAGDRDGAKVVLADARMARDFSFQPLPNAISIPIDGSPKTELERLAGIDKKSQIILYCQSSGCTYSDVVAKRLNARGYENISIYRYGVVGWREHTK